MAATSAVMALVIAGCGASPSTPAADTAATVSITDVRGVTEHSVGDKRIVAVGFAVDNVLALGIKPVAVVQQRGMTLPRPWHGNRLDGVPIIKASESGAVSVEEILTHRPDLYVGESYAITDDLYQRLNPRVKVLSSIEKQGPKSGWDAQLTALAQITGKKDEAQKVFADDAANMARVKAKYPGLSGKTAIIAQYVARSSNFNLVAAPDDPTNRFFSELGMTVPRAIRENAAYTASSTNLGGRTLVSLELLPTIGANLMAIYPNGATADDLNRLPGYAGLPQVRNDTTLVSDLTTIVSMNQPSSLSRVWILDRLDPMLARAAVQDAVA